MGFGIFGWIRERARQSVLAGIGDAANDLTAGERNGEIKVVQALSDRLGAFEALPSPEDEPGRKKK